MSDTEALEKLLELLTVGKTTFQGNGYVMNSLHPLTENAKSELLALLACLEKTEKENEEFRRISQEMQTIKLARARCASGKYEDLKLAIEMVRYLRVVKNAGLEDLVHSLLNNAISKNDVLGFFELLDKSIALTAAIPFDKEQE